MTAKDINIDLNLDLLSESEQSKANNKENQEQDTVDTQLQFDLNLSDTKHRTNTETFDLSIEFTLTDKQTDTAFDNISEIIDLDMGNIEIEDVQTGQKVEIEVVGYEKPKKQICKKVQKYSKPIAIVLKHVLESYAKTIANNPAVYNELGMPYPKSLSMYLVPRLYFKVDISYAKLNNEYVSVELEEQIMKTVCLVPITMDKLFLAIIGIPVSDISIPDKITVDIDPDTKKTVYIESLTFDSLNEFEQFVGTLAQDYTYCSGYKKHFDDIYDCIYRHMYNE